MLPADDLAYLERKGFRYELKQEANFVCLVIFDYVLPSGYTAAKVDLLLRLAAGWPDAKPDMFWMLPAVAYATGGEPGQSQNRENYLDRTGWQRFSRHLPDGVWRPGDGLETWLTKVGDILCSEVPSHA